MYGRVNLLPNKYRAAVGILEVSRPLARCELRGPPALAKPRTGAGITRHTKRRAGTQVRHAAWEWTRDTKRGRAIMGADYDVGAGWMPAGGVSGYVARGAD